MPSSHLPKKKKKTTTHDTTQWIPMDNNTPIKSSLRSEEKSIQKGACDKEKKKKVFKEESIINDLRWSNIHLFHWFGW